MGTTWKKKSMQGLPEVRKVAEPFSVRPLIGLVVGAFTLNPASSKAINGSGVVSWVEGMDLGRTWRSTGGPMIRDSIDEF